MQISVIISAVLTLLCIWEKWRALHKEESAKKTGSESEKDLVNQFKSEVLAKLECIDSKNAEFSDKLKDFNPELLVEIKRLSSENADKLRCLDLDNKLKNISSDIVGLKSEITSLKSVVNLCKPHDGYRLVQEELTLNPRKRRKVTRVSTLGTSVQIACKDGLVQQNIPT